MQKKILAALLVLAMVSLASGFQGADWIRYDSAQGRYSLLFPRQPQLTSQEANAATGEKFTQYLAQASDSDSFYMLGYFDYTANMTFSLDKARDGAVEAVNGRLLSDEAVSLGGYPGRALTIGAKNENGEFLIRSRVYHVGMRVYILQHIFTKDSDTPAMAVKTTKFFDSFKVSVVN